MVPHEAELLDRLISPAALDEDVLEDAAVLFASKGDKAAPAGR